MYDLIAVGVPEDVAEFKDFKHWHSNLTQAGNRLEGFELTNRILAGDKLFAFSAKVKVWIEKEQRFKTDESIFTRQAASVVCAFYNHPEHGRLYLLIREFRSAVNNVTNSICEFPGGSIEPGLTVIENSVKEFKEETGIDIGEGSRFIDLSSRQTLATFLTTHFYAVGVELTTEEYEATFNVIKANEHKGENEEEDIRLILANKKALLDGSVPVDWTTLGILAALDFAVENKPE